MINTDEATTTFVLANQRLAHVHVRDFMLISHHLVGNINVHLYFKKF